MHQKEIFVTYELSQNGGDVGLVRGAKSVAIRGELVHYRVGEFKNPSGKVVPAVQFMVSPDDEEFVRKQLIEVPSSAQNVRVHVQGLPEEYRGALNSSI